MFEIEQIRRALSRSHSNAVPETPTTVQESAVSCGEPSGAGVLPASVTQESGKGSPRGLYSSRDRNSLFDAALNGSASVALIFAGGDRDLQLCFIKRAERAGDPWSGHMAFPGGRAAVSDPSPQAVAERETTEEVGINLAEGSLLGRLPSLPVLRLGLDTGMMLYPFAYHLQETPEGLTLSDEVAEAYWIPVAYLWDPVNADRVEWKVEGATLKYPAIRYKQSRIWGLTYRILQEFSELIGNPLP